ncbi:hypothetical protein ACFQ7J_02440 [Streptomyces sp. NPDC056501]|uniref:hypothetical protein n=1 Tax=Streptomyces sp. NPDC056501 TaxID=3345841 RepID=UPI0036801EB1
MGRPNDTFRLLREHEWEMSRREAAEFLVKKSIEYGEPVHCVTRTIATWEDGTTACPSPPYQRLLRKVTGRAVTQLGFTPPRPPTTRRTTESDDDMRRRTMLVGTGAVLLTAARPAHSTAPDLGSDHLQQLHNAERALYAQDRDHGSAELGRQAAAALNTAHAWLRQGRYREPMGSRLHTATGNLSVAAGWLALDSGRPHDARSLYTEALASARHADDLPWRPTRSPACPSSPTRPAAPARRSPPPKSPSASPPRSAPHAGSPSSPCARPAAGPSKASAP